MKKITVFTAAYCNPCRELKRRIKQLQDERAVNVTFIAADEDWKTADKYHVKSVPTIIIEDGNAVDVVRGLVSLEDLRAVLY